MRLAKRWTAYSPERSKRALTASLAVADLFLIDRASGGQTPPIRDACPGFSL